jgi:hypothetical protein
VNDLARVREAAQQLLAMLEPNARIVDAGERSQDLYPQVAAAIDKCLATLAELELWGSENRLPSSELWNAAGHLLARGWLLNQARTKPRGYAGDYEMLARIYENRFCDDPLGRLLDRYFQAQAAPQAVRNRMEMMMEWIVEAAAVRRGPLKVAVVGSAFGLEIRDALAQLDESARAAIRVTLLDLDPSAIEFARANLAVQVKPEQVAAISTNLFRLPERPAAAQPLGDSQWIFCPGMFDYLEDTAAIAMIRCLYGQLAPGGRLLVFQFAPHNSTRGYMEWFGNWYLTYRDEGAFRALVESANLPGAAVGFGAEALGVDLYAMIRKQPVE